MKFPNIHGIKHDPDMVLENTALDKSKFAVGDKFSWAGEKGEIISYQYGLLMVNHKWNKDYPQRFIAVKLDNGEFTGIGPYNLIKL